MQKRTEDILSHYKHCTRVRIALSCDCNLCELVVSDDSYTLHYSAVCSTELQL